jgi:MFS family permease
LNTAPVASALCNKWGCRLIGIIGSIVASVAVAMSIFSPNIVVMWLSFGLIGGIGMGLVYLPSLIMVGYYFEKNRAIATGRMRSSFFTPLNR